MSRTKLLLDVVNDLRSLAEDIEAIATAIKQDDEPTTAAPASTPTTPSAPTAPTPAPAPKPDSTPPDSTRVDLVAIRALAVEKAKTAEQKAAMRDLLARFGVKKINELAEKDYPAFYKEVEALG